MAKAETPVLAGYPVQEHNLGHGFPGFDTVPVVRLGEHTFVSRHRLSDSEVEEVVRTRQLYVLTPADGPGPLRPVRVVAAVPEFTLPVLRAQMPGGESRIFHGLEVVEAGGAEWDRQDFAAAEAAQCVAALAALPCKVAIFGADKEWGDIGGEECAGREQLEAALQRRYAKALSEGGRRVEARDASGAVFKAAAVEMTPRACREAESARVPG